jgi:hypothetical protein
MCSMIGDPIQTSRLRSGLTSQVGSISIPDWPDSGTELEIDDFLCSIFTMSTRTTQVMKCLSELSTESRTMHLSLDMDVAW